MSANSASFPRLSLHVGINQVDPSYYKNNSVPELLRCVNDMTNMRELAESIRFYIGEISLTITHYLN